LTLSERRHEKIKMNAPLKIGIAGLGTVDVGVFRLLAEHAAWMFVAVCSSYPDQLCNAGRLDVERGQSYWQSKIGR